MSLHSIYITTSTSWKTLFKEHSRCSVFLADSFDALVNIGCHVSSSDFNNNRDAFRDCLTALDSANFQRWGPALIDIADIFNAINLHTVSESCLLFILAIRLT